MIGAGLKKLAAELNFKVNNGIAYGEVRNYIVTLHEGSGWKAIGIAVAISDSILLDNVNAVLSDSSFYKQYNIQRIQVTQSLIEVILLDGLGTMKKVKPAMEFVLDKLSVNQVPGVGFCSHCKNPLEADSQQIVKIGNYAYCMHTACINTIERSVTDTVQTNKENGSFGLGFLGAAIGGIIGAIPWAIVYYFGWFVGWLGFLIGICAKKGYEICKGRETKVKAFVIIFVTVIVVILAEYAACFFAVWHEFSTNPELSALYPSAGEIFTFMNETIISEPEVLRSMIVDILLGLLFAGLGIFSTIKNIFTVTSPKGPVVLEDPSRQ